MGSLFEELYKIINLGLNNRFNESKRLLNELYNVNELFRSIKTLFDNFKINIRSRIKIKSLPGNGR